MALAGTEQVDYVGVDSKGAPAATKSSASVSQIANFLVKSTGTFTCNGATAVAVTDANVTANSQVLVTLKTVGGTVGAVPSVKTITAATGFTISGTASDTSVYNYAIIG